MPVDLNFTWTQVYPIPIQSCNYTKTSEISYWIWNPRRPFLPPYRPHHSSNLQAAFGSCFLNSQHNTEIDDYADRRNHRVDRNGKQCRLCIWTWLLPNSREHRRILFCLTIIIVSVWFLILRIVGRHQCFYMIIIKIDILRENMYSIISIRFSLRWWEQNYDRV